MSTYLPFVSKGLMTYPGLPGTVSAVGNVGSLGEEATEVRFILSAGKLLVVVLDARPGLSVAAAADFLRGSRRTDTGFGSRELYAPLMASTVTPRGPPRRTSRVLAVPAVAETITVSETYPTLLTVTVKLPRRPFTNVAGVTPFSPEDSTTFALDGSLKTVSVS